MRFLIACRPGIPLTNRHGAEALWRCAHEMVERPGRGTLMRVDLAALCGQVALEAAV